MSKLSSTRIVLPVEWIPIPINLTPSSPCRWTPVHLPWPLAQPAPRLRSVTFCTELLISPKPLALYHDSKCCVHEFADRQDVPKNGFINHSLGIQRGLCVPRARTQVNSQFAYQMLVYFVRLLSKFATSDAIFRKQHGLLQQNS